MSVKVDCTFLGDALHYFVYFKAYLLLPYLTSTKGKFETKQEAALCQTHKSTKAANKLLRKKMLSVITMNAILNTN